MPIRAVVLAFVLVLATPLAAQEAEKPMDPEVLYADQSWTHVGDNNFSPESDAASDLTLRSAGTAIEIKFVIADGSKALLAGEEYRSVVFKGTAIGNDTGRLGDTTATVVELNGKKIGEVKESGSFEIVFEESILRLDADADHPNLLVLTTGQNGATDRDDQEMGMFEVRLSKKDPPVRDE